jgi:hypothetical protein
MPQCCASFALQPGWATGHDSLLVRSVPAELVTRLSHRHLDCGAGLGISRGTVSLVT